MKILVATFRYLSLTGSEIFTYTLLKSLIKKNQQVYLYSPFLGGKILKETKKLKIKIITDKIERLEKYKFDVIHCHHSPTAILLREHFKHTPIVYLMHGPLPFLEQPPNFITFNYYGYLSQEIKTHLKKNLIKANKLFYFPNAIDTNRFKPLSDLPQKPKNILILSNYMNAKGNKIALSAAKELNLKVSFIGKKKPVFAVEKYINKADIVISLGRGVIESLSCGKSVLVFCNDDNYYTAGDGIINQFNITKMALKNFSGRTFQISFNKNNLIKELKKYDSSFGRFGRKYVVEHFDMDNNIKKLIKIYKKAAKENAKKYDIKRVSYEAQLLDKTLVFNRLNIRYQNLSKLLLTRFKVQFAHMLNR